MIEIIIKNFLDTHLSVSSFWRKRKDAIKLCFI